MKNRIIALVIFTILSFRVDAQPAETIYQGTVIKPGPIDDAAYGPFNIGFNFTYFGISYSQFYVSSNGLVLFSADPANSAFTSSAIPDPATPNNFIAAFWDDLVIDGTGSILYTTIGAAPNKKLIIQFRNMGFHRFPAFMGTFDVILNESSNKIKVQFRIIVDNTSSIAHGKNATIGLENSDGTAGVQYAFHDSTAVATGKAISYTPSGSTYTLNPDAMYEGLYLTTNTTQPEPGIPALLSPPQNGVIGSDFTFSWADAGNAASYSLLISSSSDLAGATFYSAGSDLSYNVTGLPLVNTFYWGVFATNSTGTTWCEIKKFTTSDAPPIAAVPQTVWVEQNQDKIIKLQYTGGDASAKTAIITSLPPQGQLFQYDAGVKGSVISSAPASVSDIGRNVIYTAPPATGNGLGNFNFKINDATGDSPEALIAVNVCDVRIPNVLNTAKNANVEIRFDIPMADPAGKQAQFASTVNGNPVIINSVSLKDGDAYSIVLSLATPLVGTETVLISYTQGDIAGSTGGLLPSFTDQSVTLKAQTLAFSQSLSKKYSDSPFTLTATASSNLPVTYSSSNLGVATAVGSVLTFHSIGTSVITARQAGNSTYAPARYDKVLTVDKGDQIITFDVLPDKTVEDADFAPGAIASSGLPVSYSSSNTSVAVITSGMIHIVGKGTSIITASQSGNSNYNAAVETQQPLTVSLETGFKDPIISKTGFNIYITVYNINILPLGEEWDGKKGSVSIIGLSGETVSSLQNVMFRKNNLIQIDSPVTPGIYFVNLKSGVMRYVGKVIIR